MVRLRPVGVVGREAEVSPTSALAMLSLDIRGPGKVSEVGRFSLIQRPGMAVPVYD
jgi:hypothetical protein